MTYVRAALGPLFDTLASGYAGVFWSLRLSEVSVSVSGMTDPLAPSNGAPPRQVEPWTQVAGHVVVTNRPQAFCSCNERAPRDWTKTAREWRAAHLREAWPELIPQLQGESDEDWLTRIALEHSDALRALADIDHRPQRDGEPIPVMTNEDEAADDRLEVLEHQLMAVQAKVTRRNGWG